MKQEIKDTILQEGIIFYGDDPSIIVINYEPKTDNNFTDNWLLITKGKGEGQVRLISEHEHDAFCGVIRISVPFDIIPNETSFYQVISRCPK